MTLRDYQVEMRSKTREAFKEFDTVLVVAPTGTGKTVFFAAMVKSFFPRRSMIIAHRKELVFQARNQIEEMTGLSVGVEMGECKTHQGTGGLFGREVAVVSSVQTQTSGGDGYGRIGKFDPMEFGLLVIDEAHHATSSSYRRLIEYYRTNPKLKVLGVTATPDRSDEEALGQVFETVSFDYEILDAIRDGWLVPVNQQMVDVSGLDFSEVRTTAGDLNGADLASIMESEKNLHGVAGPTIDIIGDRSTLVFTSSVKHAQQLAEIFNRHKYGMADWVCGATDEDERNTINAKFKSGAVQILCNCGTHTEGFDADLVSVIVMARPTQSRSLYAQMVGRATRPLKGLVDGHPSPDARRRAIANSPKPSCLIIDFVGNSGKHKLVTSVDILGGNISDEVIEATILRARKSGKPVEVAQAIEEEEKAAKEREARKLADIARRERLIAKAKYAVSLVDPFDVLQVKPVKQRGWDNDKDLSEKQRNALRRFGMDPDKILREKGYTNARNILDACFQRVEKHLCTFGQAKVLKRFGYPADMTFDAASKTIDALAKNKWNKLPGGPVVGAPKAKLPPPPPKPKPAPAYDPDATYKLSPDDDNVPF